MAEEYYQLYIDIANDKSLRLQTVFAEPFGVCRSI